MNKKFLYINYILIISFIFILSLPGIVFASDPKLISTLNNAFEKLEGYLVKLSTPAAAVAVGSGVFMKKFSFGDEEKMRTSKKIIRGTFISYGLIILLDLILSAIESLLV